MQLLMRKGEGEVPEWFVIEMQGDLESRNKEHLEGKFIGDLHYTKEGVPIMIIGHHILYGKVSRNCLDLAVLIIDFFCLQVQSLERPLVSVEKVETGGDLKRNEGEELMDLDEEMEVKVEYRVKSIIKKKIIFKNRPKPIIANLPKPV